jgi:Fe-Mn family superoxide dismutase
MRSYTLPDLPYDYSALEPKLSAKAMEIHHLKHHAKYVDGANMAMESLVGAKNSETAGLEQALAFNVGGHLLHSEYWKCLCPDVDQQPSGALMDAICDSFGSFDTLAKRLTAAITTVQGSGWAALVWEPLAQRLLVTQLQDHQGNAVVGAELIIVADAWEHAHYLDYQADKAAWAKAFLSLANWTHASETFEASAWLVSPVPRKPS